MVVLQTENSHVANDEVSQNCPTLPGQDTIYYVYNWGRVSILPIP